MTVKLVDHGISLDTFNFHNDAMVPVVRNVLNSTGPGFCLAKFRQITLHLGTGMVHSCHHPTPHRIPLDEIAEDPMRLLNTSRLKEARTQMLNGEKPSECDYCWRVEANGSNSDRYIKSKEPWAFKDHDVIASLKGDEDINPTYLEVSFSNACNLACIYCGPEFSSKWVEELKQHGRVELFTELGDRKVVAQGYQDLDDLNYRQNEDNPYINAFWEIFPRIYSSLKHYRITGGEPLMSKETFRSMDWFIDNPNQELEFSINSNLGVPEKLWKKFIDRLKVLRDGRVKKITIYTSIEGWGERASYSRHGLVFDVLKTRVEQLASLGNIRVVIMSTFNIFSVTSFKPLLEWVCELKRKHNPNNELLGVENATGFIADHVRDLRGRKAGSPSQSVVVGIDIPYLRQPTWFDAQLCTHDLVEGYLLPALEFMSANTCNPSWIHNHQGFDQHEFEKLKRIVLHRMYWIKKSDLQRETASEIVRDRAMFYDFVTEMDFRRGTNFLDTFPEMDHFFGQCAVAKEAYIKRMG